MKSLSLSLLSLPACRFHCLHPYLVAALACSLPHVSSPVAPQARACLCSAAPTPGTPRCSPREVTACRECSPVRCVLGCLRACTFVCLYAALHADSFLRLSAHVCRFDLLPHDIMCGPHIVPDRHCSSYVARSHAHALLSSLTTIAACVCQLYSGSACPETGLRFCSVSPVLYMLSFNYVTPPL